MRLLFLTGWLAAKMPASKYCNKKTRHCCMDEGEPSQAHQMNPYLHILSIPEGQSPPVKLADGRSPLQVLKHETHFSKQGIWPGIGS